MDRKQRRSLIILILIVLAVVLIICLAVNSFNGKTKEENVSEFDFLSLIGSGVEEPLKVGNNQIISHTGYKLSYNEQYEVADWVCYEFTNEELNTRLAQRKDNFREDPLVTTGSASLEDYKKSGYSRGHLAPAADFKWSEEAMSDTFYMSNMTPQLQNNFNAGIWLKAENFVRELCEKNKVVFVVSGPVLTDGPYETIGKNKVAVPKNFYKVLLAVAEDGLWSSYAMIIPHDASKNDDLSMYFVSIDYVEEITGLDFFPSLEDSIENLVEQ